jgi:ribosomal protein L7/L12
MKTLPDDSKMRAQYPIMSGCFAYFPAALAGVARHSYIGGAKYNDGGLVHLRYISAQHMDCIGRHLLDLQDLLAAKERGETEVNTLVYAFDLKRDMPVQLSIDEAILIECNALAWRSLAVSQELHEKLGSKPLAPAARTEPPVPPIKPIKLLSFGKNKVAVVKAIREVAYVGLKEAVDAVNNLPSEIFYNAAYGRDRAISILIEAGGIVE